MMITLAQALRLKNKLVADINTLEERLKESIVQYETETPAPYSSNDFAAMLADLQLRRESLLKLKKAIDKANHTVMNNTCVQEQIYLRGELKAELDFFEHLRTSSFSSTQRSRFDNNSPKYICYMTVKAADAEISKLKSKLADIDNEISNLNAIVKIDFP